MTSLVFFAALGVPHKPHARPDAHHAHHRQLAPHSIDKAHRSPVHEALAAAPSCPPGCEPDYTAVVHGDPMFKVNGSGTHFWIKQGVLTPLLEWTPDSDPSATMVLSGSTFDSAETGSQWFDRFVVSHNDKVVAEIGMSKGGMQVKFDGQTVPKNQRRPLDGTGPVKVQRSTADDAVERVQIEAGGTTLYLSLIHI